MTDTTGTSAAVAADVAVGADVVDVEWLWVWVVVVGRVVVVDEVDDVVVELLMEPDVLGDDVIVVAVVPHETRSRPVIDTKAIRRFVVLSIGPTLGPSLAASM